MTIVNAAESKITSINAMTDYDFQPIENTNKSNPSIVYNPYYEMVTDLDISILATKDNSVPSKVELGVFGCGNPSPLFTKGVIEPTPTPKATRRPVSGVTTGKSRFCSSNMA